MASDLEIRIGAELTEIKAALNGLQKDLKGVEDTARNAGRDSLGGLTDGIRSASTAMQGLVAAFAAVQVGGKLIELADQAQNLSARLRLVTNSAAEFSQAMQGVTEIANNTRQPIKDVGDLYARLAQNLDDPPKRLLALTQTISKAVTLSGSSAESAQAAIIQLGQGLAAGQLRGEELNSVLEQTPRLARALEEGLGLARGGLRAFAAEGKITAEAVKQALENQADVIDREFSQLPTTIGQSFTLLNNAALQFVGVMDEANGLSLNFASSVKLLADNFNILAGAITAVVSIPLAIAIGRAATAIGAAVVGMVALGRAAGTAAAATTLLSRAVGFLGGPIGAVLTLLGLASAAYTAFGSKSEEANAKTSKSTLQSTTDIIAALDKQIAKLEERNRIARQGAAIEPTVTDAAVKNLAEQEKRYKDAVERIKTAQDDAQREQFSILAQNEARIFAALRQRVQRLESANNESQAIEQDKKRAEYLKEYATNAEKLAAELAKAKKELGAAFTPDIERRIRERFATQGQSVTKAGQEAQEKLLKDSTQRQLDILGEFYDKGLIDAGQYFESRTQIEVKAIDAAIAIEQQRARGNSADRAKALAEIQILEAQKTDVLRKATAEREKAVRELAIESAQNQQRIDQTANQGKLSSLERLNEQQRISIAAYYEQRDAIEIGALDNAIDIERLRSQGSVKEQRAALAQIAVLEEQKKQIVERSAAERLATEKRLTIELTNARIQQLQAEGKIQEAERLRLELQFSDLIKRLKIEGNTAGVQLIEGLINTGAARAQFEELRAQFDRVVDQMQQRQITINAQRDTGAISGDTATSQTTEARQQAIDQLTSLNTKLQELAANSNDPAIVQGAMAAANALRQLGIDGAIGVEKAVITLRASLAQMKQAFAENTVNAGVDALTGFFNDIATGTKSAGDALKDFVRSFAASMLQIAARALATFLVLQMLDAVYPGLGQVTAATMGATVKHSGGMAGTGPIRKVDPLLFAGAPRYHSGGMVGLKPGEVPAILQTGEEVLSRNDPRNQANGGGGSGAGVRIINTIDPEMAGEYFNSPQGERTFVNLISRNAATLRNVLA